MDVRCTECAAMLRTDDAVDGGVTDELLLPCEFCCGKEVETRDFHFRCLVDYSADEASS